MIKLCYKSIGTLGIERNIAYKSLKKSWFSVEQAKYLVREADKYFEDLGYNLYSLTRRLENRICGGKNGH